MLGFQPRRRRRLAFGGALLVFVVGIVLTVIPGDRFKSIGPADAIGTSASGGSSSAVAAEADIRDFGAVCDGVQNDRYAIRNAISYLSGLGGGVLNIPAGDCRMLQTAQVPYTYLPGNFTVRGQGASSRLSLACDVASGYNEMFRIKGDNITIENVSIVRSTPCSGVMLDIYPASNFTLRNVIIDGQGPSISGTMHGMVLASVRGAVYNNLTISNSVFRNLRFGFFQANNALTTTDSVLVDGTTFSGNSADDLEFNAPQGVMRNITVQNSTFVNNKSTASASGFGVGFANVQGAVVANNTFDSYSYEPVHIEDRSSQITVSGNRFTNSFTASKSWASHIFIINDSHFITIQNNLFDTTGNTNRFQAVFVGTGGSTYLKPSDVSIIGNTYILRPNAAELYAYGISRVTTSGSLIIGIP